MTIGIIPIYDDDTRKNLQAPDSRRKGARTFGHTLVSGRHGFAVPPGIAEAEMPPCGRGFYACAHDEIKGFAGCIEDVVTYTHWRYINNTDIIPERGYISNTGISKFSASKQNKHDKWK